MTGSDGRGATRPPAPVRDLDWEPERARELGSAVVDLWGELLERLRELPVSRRSTVADVRPAVALPIPDEPMPLDRLLDHLRDLTFEHATYLGHPRYMAYITGAGTVPGAAADLLMAGLNQNQGGWRLAPGATEIELHLLRWFAARLGLPPTAGGAITSGGALSAFIGLKLARDARAGWDVRDRGVAAGGPLAIYASTEVHGVNVRAADMLGLGRGAVRQVAVDGSLRMRVDALRDAIEADQRRGVRPLAVVGSAGTVATGAIDPLDEIADVCAGHGCWFHVDGAYGGVAALTSALRPLFRGIERADSVALDPHKWLYTPQSGGAVVVREFERLGASFSVDASYVFEDKELTGRGVDFHQLTPNFSWGFHALKIWVSLLAHGWAAYERRIVHDVELARYLRARVEEHDELEPMGPESPLSIACFRYVPRDVEPGESGQAYLDDLNERLMAELQMAGRVYPSNAILDGRFALRACIVNFRTEAEDLDVLVDEAVTLGGRLHAELRPAASSPGRVHA